MADPLQLHDAGFAGAIERVSEKGTHWYTERQLWHEVLRRLPGAPGMGCAAAGLLALTLPVFLAMSVFGGTSTVSAGASNRLPFDVFRERYLARWIEVHGVPDHLVTPEMVAREVPPPSPELSNFSFDRALVVETRELAAMLIANRFHFENNCAVLSLDRRFPAGPAFDSILAMLSRNPSLVVHVLHDASPIGSAMALALRDAQWFPDPAVRIADLGLTPAQAQAARVPVWQGEALGHGATFPLPDAEADALRTGKRWDLEALRPARLLSVAWRGFSRVAEHAREDRWNEDGIWIAGYGWGPGIWILDDGWHAHDHWAGMAAADLDAGAADSFG